ncbi:MAG TPA: Asp23/Gls24 family envelope stress response protein [Candidatus Dormibacteraeota bacterium]|nr:Asp23/Gls24 family envelope stress response protein [Candidatus Dormibacteraeota bacterium]
MSSDGERLELVHGGGGRERLGTVRVANEVVARISALAALEVDGVHAMYQASGSQQLDRILRRPAAHRGVKVELLDDDRLRLDVFVVMEAGTQLPVMGATVQRRVADAIDRMLGLAIAEVNVFVSEVVFS